MSIINTATQLNAIIKSLDDIIRDYDNKKLDNPRTALSVLFLSGTPSPHTHDLITQNANFIRAKIIDLRNVVRDQNISSTHTPIKTAFEELKIWCEQRSTKEIYFMLGDHGILAHLHALHANDAGDTHIEQQKIVYKTSIFVMVCQRHQQWDLFLNSLTSTLHNRPIIEHLHQAIHGLSDPSMGAFELQLLPDQIIKTSTPGNPTRVHINQASQSDIVYLYDKYYRDYRHAVKDGNITQVAPHPDHEMGISSYSAGIPSHSGG